MEESKVSKTEDCESPHATPSSNIDEEDAQQEFVRNSTSSPERSQDMYQQNYDVNSHIPKDLHYEGRHFHSADMLDEETDQHSSNLDNTNDNYLDISDEILNPEVLLTTNSEIQDDDSAFSCKYPHCGFRTTDTVVFLKHEDSHIDGKSYQCDICHMKFTLFANMRRHKLSHLGVRPFECRLCTKRFFRKDHLMEHLVRQHSKQRPYRCPFCIKSFNFRPHLKVHLSSEHSGVAHDKTCRICGFKASSLNGAKIHFTICHLKQSASDISESNTSQSNHNYISMSQTHQTIAENEAIDLGTISQNFSFIPPQYPPFNITGNESSSSMAGPSDLSCSFPRISRAATPTTCTLSTENNREQRSSEHMAPVDPSPVSSLASSTTAVSPSVCRTNTACYGNNIEYAPDHLSQARVSVKPEPPEVVIDDSQNSNVQPTSTMDMTTSIVETTYSVHETTGRHPCSSEISFPRKAKHSSGDEAGSEQHPSPPLENNADSQEHYSWETEKCSNATSRSRYCHSKYKEPKYRHGSVHCKHSHSPHCNNLGKRERAFETSSCNDDMKLADCNSELVTSDRKLISFRSTAPVSSRDLHMSEETTRHHSPSSCQRNVDVPHTSKSQIDDHFNDDKSALMFSKYERNTLVCPYCGIVFPDQTLYFLHRSLHTEASPWKCNLCGKHCKDKYDFNSHIISQAHH